MIYPNILVQSGSSLILKQQKKIIKANLGSCIGTAIWDDVNKIGGLIHILLPEPYSEFADIEEKYATTGLPKFIDELIGLGAEIDFLKAAVAGGGFPGLPESIDVSVNIGGKTAEKVSEILKFYKIPVYKAETGGFFSSSLSLNMDTFEAEITPIIHNQAVFSEKNTPDFSKTDLYKKADEIEPIPQIILKIIKMINTKYTGMKEIADEIKKDQVISAKAIKICNSAAFDRLYSISTIDEAIIQLGEENLIKHILNYYLEKLFTATDKGYSLCKGGLFYHSLAAAFINEKLCQFTGLEIPAKGYSAGLLHDIGKILLDQSMADLKPFFYRDISEKCRDYDILEIENNILGTNHCKAGVIISEKWNFPDNLKQVVKFHHDPELAEKDQTLVILTYLSDIISSWFVTGVLPETSRIKNSFKILEKVSLTPDKIQKFIDWLPLRDFASLFPLQLDEVSGKKECEKDTGACYADK
jgi:putative nucleotidyltransferase with HDIG domain